MGEVKARFNDGVFNILLVELEAVERQGERLGFKIGTEFFDSRQSAQGPFKYLGTLRGIQWGRLEYFGANIIAEASGEKERDE